MNKLTGVFVSLYSRAALMGTPAESLVARRCKVKRNTSEEADACPHDYREAWAAVRRQAIQTIRAVLETGH